MPENAGEELSGAVDGRTLSHKMHCNLQRITDSLLELHCSAGCQDQCWLPAYQRKWYAQRLPALSHALPASLDAFSSRRVHPQQLYQHRYASAYRSSYCGLHRFLSVAPCTVEPGNLSTPLSEHKSKTFVGLRIRTAPSDCRPVSCAAPLRPARKQGARPAGPPPGAGV